MLKRNSLLLTMDVECQNNKKKEKEDMEAMIQCLQNNLGPTRLYLKLCDLLQKKKILLGR